MSKIKEQLENLIIEQESDSVIELEVSVVKEIINTMKELERYNQDAIDYLASTNSGLYHHRIEENLVMKEFDWNNREKTFAFMWKGQSKMLESFFINKNKKIKIDVDNKIKVAVATVIQWLGSNVGWSFLENVLDKEGYKIIKK